eukprot:CAMPEP_0196735744 /NCGR_PEP_ID=MMETSP1091-20130531/14060_1 /TAXON_ID=302021 /ORGANISM="Rhodomonas sp., Strain CCMP768" /LENGTH=415 /DNA_ID=CAMNT_0042079409 /DNA_START=33 /DNA_END=1280 /DNA_ORIENTATION=-
MTRKWWRTATFAVLALVGFANAFRLPACSPIQVQTTSLLDPKSRSRPTGWRASSGLRIAHRAAKGGGDQKPSKTSKESKVEAYTEEDRRRQEENVSDFDFWTAAGGGSELEDTFAELALDLTRSRVKAGGRVLDLMAGSETLLAPEAAYFVCGVGLVDEHLRNNPLLDQTVTVDLNDTPGPDLCGAGGLEPASFDTVLCSGALPYLTHPEHAIAQGVELLTEDGVLVVSWSSSVRAEKATAGWLRMDTAQQLDFVKHLLVSAGLSSSSLRVDVSGPTHGDKLCVVSAAKAAPSPAVTDKVSGVTLKEALRTQKRSRRDRQRQKEQDEKPFRLRVVSPPPAQLLEGTFSFPPRTHNGDKVEVNGRRYVVSKVQFQYSFRGGRYRLDEKVLEVQQQKRYETNERLKTLLDESDEDDT